MDKIRKKPLLLFFVLLIALYIIIYVVPRVTGALRSSYTAEYGRLQTSDETEGYVVRNETIYTAGKSGTINRYIQDGKLVRKGTRVMDVTSSGKTMSRTYEELTQNLGSHRRKSDSYAAAAEGIVVYYADGMEGVLTPDTMAKQNRSFYRGLKSNGQELARDETAENDPVFKIVDRSAWYIVCYVPTDHASRYQVGEKVSISINGSSSIRGTVQEMKKESGSLRLILRTNYYYKGFGKLRTVDLSVITADRQGLIIYNSSIVEKDGQKGVMVRQKNGKYQFTRINVLATDGEKSAISMSSFRNAKGESVRTVRNYDEVLRRG